MRPDWQALSDRYGPQVDQQPTPAIAAAESLPVVDVENRTVGAFTISATEPCEECGDSTAAKFFCNDRVLCERCLPRRAQRPA